MLAAPLNFLIEIQSISLSGSGKGKEFARRSKQFAHLGDQQRNLCRSPTLVLVGVPSSSYRAPLTPRCKGSCEF